MNTVPGWLADLARRLEPIRCWDALGVGNSSASASGGQSAVLALITGTSRETAQLLLQERAHTLRSQPAQFALPGGRRDPGEVSPRATALREACEEVGLDPAAPAVLGQLPAMELALRGIQVVPVVAWLPRLPPLRLQTAEVHRVLSVPLTGPGSLTDPAVTVRALVGERDFGIGWDLPLDPDDPEDDAFVWGFTAQILRALLEAAQLPVPTLTVMRQVPAHRVWTVPGRLDGIE